MTYPAVFDHLSIAVTELARSSVFYDEALSALGLTRLASNARSVCYGPPGFDGEAPFAIVVDLNARAAMGTHVAFRANSRESVDRFYSKAVASGGVCDGPPGIRYNYNPGYYAAFVRDPDGHRIEAVLHEKI